jgi:hypothetical protein
MAVLKFSVQTGDIGNRVVAQVKILRFISPGECTGIADYYWPLEQSRQTTPTSYALAEVLSVRKGTFDAKTAMLCSDSGWGHFAIGQIGTVYGTTSRNGKTRWRVNITETYSERAARRRAEGAFCILIFCFDLPERRSSSAARAAAIAQSL